MPSPIAHSAMALVAVPLLLQGLPPGVNTARRFLLAGGVVFVTVAADLDIPLGFAAGADGFRVHGGFTHSILMAIVFATMFAICARLIAPIHPARAWMVGGLAYGSHLLLDAVNHGRGVMLLWPLNTDRYSAPFQLFYGVHYSDLTDWSSHLITLVTELIFFLVVLMLAYPLYARNTGGLIPPDRS